MIQPLGKLYVVATPIGNLEDISPRAQRVLSQVTWVAAEDTRHSGNLLKQLGIPTPLISYYEQNEQERCTQLITRLQQGENGALITDAGTPLISDPGYLIVAAAHAANIPVIAVPGPCSVIAALSIAGLPTDRFLFEGFLPAKTTARRKRLSKLADSEATLVFFEGPHRILDLLTDCADIFPAPRRLSLAREITKKFESVYLNTAAELLIAAKEGTIPLKGEFIVMVEGFKSEAVIEDNVEMARVLTVLLAEMPLKQAVQIAVKLTGLPKNALYDCATQLQRPT